MGCVNEAGRPYSGGLTLGSGKGRLVPVHGMTGTLIGFVVTGMLSDAGRSNRTAWDATHRRCKRQSESGESL
jgi:hypothetical protein